MLTRKQLGTLTRTIAVGNYKGGVGKTTVTANVAALLARDGHRVLVVDLDDQGDQRTMFGLQGTDVDDDGADLLDAFTQGRPFKPKATKVDGLDMIVGGSAVEQLEQLVVANGGDADVATRFAVLLAELAGDYDAVLIDCPPKSRALLRVALIAARWVLIPIKSDENSASGIERLADSVADAQTLNPRLEALGVVLFDFDKQGSVLKSETRDTVAQIMGEGMTFDADIRHAPGVSFAEQRRGESAFLIAEAVEQQQPAWHFLRRGIRGTRFLPASAKSVRDDYVTLYRELVERVRRTDSGFAPKLEEIAA